MAADLAKQGHEDLAVAMMDLNQRASMYMMYNAVPRSAAKGIKSLRPHTVSKTPSLMEFGFGRKYKGVKGPLSLLDDISDGSVSRDTVSAVKYVYPELHTEIVSQTMSQVAEMKANGDYLPMDKIVTLGLALGAPIDRVLEKDYVTGVQMALNAPPADQPPPKDQPPPTVVAMDQNGLLTPLQNLSV